MLREGHSNSVLLIGFNNELESSKNMHYYYINIYLKSLTVIIIMFPKIFVFSNVLAFYICMHSFLVGC